MDLIVLTSAILAHCEGFMTMSVRRKLRHKLIEGKGWGGSLSRGQRKHLRRKLAKEHNCQIVHAQKELAHAQTAVITKAFPVEVARNRVVGNLYPRHPSSMPSRPLNPWNCSARLQGDRGDLCGRHNWSHAHRCWFCGTVRPVQ